MKTPKYWPSWASFYASTTHQPGTFFQNEPDLVNGNVWIDFLDGMVQRTRQKQESGEPWIVCRPKGYKPPLTKMQRFRNFIRKTLGI